jgi:hypothetical protein
MERENPSNLKSGRRWLRDNCGERNETIPFWPVLEVETYV